MKYKLINNNTKEEHLCDKVTIDGFDYYMSDEEIKNNDWYYWSVTNNIQKALKDSLKRLPKSTGGSKKVIATNNPNIDIPKVVDEVEKEAMAYLDRNYSLSYEKTTWQSLHEKTFKAGYNKSQETHPYSKQDMIEFTKWLAQQEWTSVWGEGKWVWECQKEDNGIGDKTEEELIEIWEQQRIITIHYE